MPRASTFVFLLAALGLYIVGMTTPAQFALFLSMGCEIVFWKRVKDQMRTARIARASRYPRARR
jgi:hypothetical protein